MDINNYSYTPSMLDDSIILSYKNDDMYIEVAKSDYGFYNVWAYSYDGQLDVYEAFSRFTTATALYNHIVDHYANTAPDEKELSACIFCLHNSIGEIEGIIDRLDTRTNPHNSKRYTRLIKQYNALKRIKERRASLDYAFWRGVESCIKKGADLTFVV